MTTSILDCSNQLCQLCFCYYLFWLINSTIFIFRWLWNFSHYHLLFLWHFPYPTSCEIPLTPVCSVSPVQLSSHTCGSAPQARISSPAFGLPAHLPWSSYALSLPSSNLSCFPKACRKSLNSLVGHPNLPWLTFLGFFFPLRWKVRWPSRTPNESQSAYPGTRLSPSLDSCMGSGSSR